MKKSCVAFLVLMLATCTQREPVAAARVDHVIVGVSDLEQGVREMERRTGIRAVTGGTHPGHGTRNALLSLGEDTYLEIYAPNPGEPVASAAVAELRGLKRPTPIGWAASTSDPQALRSTLKARGFPLTPAEPGSRRKPDGTIVSWVTYGFATLDHPLAPFFIEWSDAETHPSRTSPGGCSLRSIRIEDPSADRLQHAIDPLGLNVVMTKSPESRMTVELSCSTGRVTIG